MTYRAAICKNPSREISAGLKKNGILLRMLNIFLIFLSFFVITHVLLGVIL